MTSQQIAVAPAPVVVRGPSVFARTPAIVTRWAWRTRWQLAPLAFGAVVFFVGYGAPLGTAGVLAVVAALALLASRGRKRARMVLSHRERRVLAVWAAAAAVWAASGSFTVLEPRWSAASLAALVLAPSWQWARSRTVRRGKLGQEARRLVETWAVYATVAGRESPHHASEVVPGSVRTTSTGGTVLDVRLGVHAEDATTESARRSVEFFYHLPLGTVALSTVRDDSGLIRVSFNPRREMEAVEGIPIQDRPRVQEDGRIPIAVTPRGEKVGPRAFDKDGVKHMWINGGTGSGKSTTAAVVLLPPVLDGHEILIYLDGKGGTSLAEELEPIMTVIAETPEEWRAAIRAFGALIDSRQANRKRITRWRGKGGEPYPAVRLVIEEAPDVSESVGPIEHGIVTRAGRAGRALGLAVTQISQGTNADQLVGGRAWRANASQVLVHRPGDSQDANKAANSSSDLRVDPMKLPSGPGWNALLDHGDTWMPTRVENPAPGQVGSWTRGFQAGTFTGTDREAVDPHLNPTEPVPEDDEPDEPGARDRLTNLIRAHERVTLGLLAPKDGTRPHTVCDTPGCPAWTLGRRQTYTHLNALLADGALAKGGSSWLIAE